MPGSLSAGWGCRWAGWIDQKDLDYRFADGKPYGAIGYEHVFWALRLIPIPSAEVELVDYGAGKGRAVVAAATREFRRVTGVEMSPGLAAEARRNVVNMRGRRAKEVEVVTANALEWPIPATANIFYFYNPFAGASLARMTERIRESVEQHPRPAFILFFNPRHFAPIAEQHDWIRERYRGCFYPDCEFALYEVDPQRAARGTGPPMT